MHKKIEFCDKDEIVMRYIELRMSENVINFVKEINSKYDKEYYSKNKDKFREYYLKNTVRIKRKG